MDILVACECSGVVRDALIARGHNAVSCDLKPTERPGPHIQGDAVEALRQHWDGLVAHPTCRYLTNAGVRWLHTEPRRWQKMLDAAAFFRLFDRADHIPKRVVENPIMHKYAREAVGRNADLFVQPWWFGDPFSKATGLWLTNLAKPVRQFSRSDYPSIKQECWLMPPGTERETARSRTYPGIGDAIATLFD